MAEPERAPAYYSVRSAREPAWHRHQLPEAAERDELFHR